MNRKLKCITSYSAVHRDEDPADYVEYNEITAYLSMLHYIEGIFTRYNKDDKDTSLSPKELWKLYETLKVYVYEKVEHGLYSRELGKPESKSTIEEIKAAKIATNMEVESYKNKKGVSISYDSDTFVELQEESPTPIVKESLEENPEQVYYIDEHLFDRLAKNTFTFIANNKRKPKGSIEKVLSIRLNHNLYNFKNVLGSIDRLGLSQIFSVMIRMSDNKVDVSDQLDFVNFLKYEKAVNSTDLSSMQKSVQAEISTLKLAVNNIILSCPSSTDERIKYSCLKNSVYSYYVEKQSKYKITESLLRNKYIKKRDRLFRLLFPTGNLEKVEEHLFRMLLVFKFIEDHILPVSDVNYDGAINWGAAEEEHLELDYLVRYFKKNISDYEIKLASFERQSLGGAHPIAYFSEDSVEATTVTEELDYKNIVAQMLSLENYYDRSTSEEVFSALDRLVSPYGLNLVTDPSEVPGEAETIDIAYPLLFFAQKLTSLKYFNADL